MATPPKRSQICGRVNVQLLHLAEEQIRALSPRDPAGRFSYAYQHPSGARHAFGRLHKSANLRTLFRRKGSRQRRSGARRCWSDRDQARTGSGLNELEKPLGELVAAISADTWFRSQQERTPVRTARV